MPPSYKELAHFVFRQIERAGLYQNRADRSMRVGRVLAIGADRFLKPVGNKRKASRILIFNIRKNLCVLLVHVFSLIRLQRICVIGCPI